MKFRKIFTSILFLFILYACKNTVKKNRPYKKYAGSFNEIYIKDNLGKEYLGLLNSKGELIAYPIYQTISMEYDGVVLARKNKEFNIIDSTGKIIFRDSVHDVGDFCKDKYVRIFDKKYGLFDVSGNEILPMKYDFIGGFGEAGIGMIKKNEKWGYIKWNGEFLTPIQYSSIYPFNDGFGLINDNGKYFFIDENGKNTFSNTFSNAKDFHQGLASVSLKNGKYGVINKRGETVLPFVYDQSVEFHDGLATIKKNDKSAMIDTLGNLKIPFQYDVVINMSNDHFIIVDKQKYGLLSRDGFIIKKPTNEGPIPFTNGFGAFKKNNKVGIFNRFGDVIINPKFDFVYGFNKNGIAGARLNNKWGLIDTFGVIKVKFEFDDILDFNDGICIAKKGLFFGMIDYNNNVILPFEYENTHSFGDHQFTIFSKGGKHYVVNKLGKVVRTF